MTASPFSEKRVSQRPALQLLINLGYESVPPERALALRGGRLGNIILDEVLREQLKGVRYDGLQRTNENVYDLLTLGTTLEQTIEGDSASANLHPIVKTQMGAALDKNSPEWEYDGYPNAGRPALEQGSLSARSDAQAERLSAVRGPRR